MKRKAFTLIELLVVIAIIAIMLSIFMPALAKAKRRGKTLVCMTNMRQMLFAASVYADDNDQYYPPARLVDPDPFDMLTINASWDFVHTKDWSTMINNIKPGLLWQGDTIEKIHQCPSFKGQANSTDLYTGYNYNISYIGHGDGEKITQPARVTDVRNPSRCALFGDGEYYSGANKFMRSPWQSDGDAFNSRAAGTQGFRHDEKTNVAWCDGHVSTQSELYTETTDSQKKLIEDHNAKGETKIGFLSPDNRAYDLK